MSNPKPAPIALFAYNRPDHAQRTVEALRCNHGAAETDIFIFCDGPKSDAVAPAVEEVRRRMRQVIGFKSVTLIEHEENLGLANSIIAGVTQVCNEFGRIIVVEDDLVTSPQFLSFMNAALDLYENEEAVGSIHGYWYPVDRPMHNTFFLRGASCWGWATWSRAWSSFEHDGSKSLARLENENLCRQFDLDGSIAYTQMLRDQIAGKNNSWAIRWHATMFLENRLQLSPPESLVRNTGFDGSGAHCTQSNSYAVDVAQRPINLKKQALKESAEARSALIRYYRKTRGSLPARAIGKLRRLVGI